MLQNAVMVRWNAFWHYIVNFSALKFSLFITEDPLASTVHLVHYTTVFAIKLKEDYAMLFTCDFTCWYLFFIMSLYLESFGLLQNSHALLLVIEHANQVLGIQTMAIYVFESSHWFPGLVYTPFLWKQDICQIIKFFEIALGVRQKVPEFSKHSDWFLYFMLKGSDDLFSLPAACLATSLKILYSLF